jgi:hypothetical protein
MTTGRRVALAIGVPVALAIIGWTALTLVATFGQASYRVSLRIPVHGPSVTVSVDSGQVGISGGAPGVVRVHGQVHYALVRPGISWQRTPSGISLQSRCHSVTGPCSFDYQVAMPAGAAADVTDGSGDLAARGLHGPVTLHTDSGQISATALTGDVLISNQSGDVTAAGLSGRNVVIRAGSGNIAATGLTGPGVTVTNQSGDVTLIFASVPSRVRVTCDSGDIKLVLPPGNTAYHLEARTSSGTTDLRVPKDTSSPHVVTVTDQSGDISVTR